MSTNLPAPDPAAGTAAEQAANEQRQTALAGLADGSLSLTDLFAQVDAETDHHHLGHIHARALLVALPKIGEVKADAILAEVGIPSDRHVDAIGADQRAAIVAVVEAA